MAAKAKRYYVQYSKRITAWLTVFWCIARIFSLIAVYINPSCGPNIATIIRGLDDIEMVVVLSYTGNSVSEKVAISYFKSKTGTWQDEQEDDSQLG
jgi:hypothetical protein